MMPNHPSRNKHTRPGPLMAPTGAEIVGTLEVTPGFCDVSDVERLDDGSIDIVNGDGGTEHWYDDQETVTDDDHIILVDVNGYNWRADQLIHKSAKPCPDARPWAPTTRVSELIEALRAALPHVKARMNQLASTGDPTEDYESADAALRLAYAALGRDD